MLYKRIKQGEEFENPQENASPQLLNWTEDRIAEAVAKITGITPAAIILIGRIDLIPP